jgi:hypothetical protein
MLWICEPKLGGCGFIGTPKDFKTMDHRDEVTDELIDSVTICPCCDSECICAYNPDEPQIVQMTNQ